MSVAVRIEDLSVRLGDADVLDGVSLEAEPGEFVTLLGPSGSGKTTTLNVIAGFVEHQRGRVTLGEQVVDALPPHKRNIGFVFQSYALFPHMTVARNVEYPLAARKLARGERDRRVREALELVQLPDAGPRAVRSLSGGQQQRVALARALVFEPSLLLLDEPLAALDKQLRDTMQLEVRRIHERTGMTTIAVTHDQVEAMTMSDRVVILDGGRISQAGTPEEVYERPANLFVAGFLGEANLLAARDGAVPALGAATSGARTGTAVVRPEQLELTADASSGRPGTVARRELPGHPPADDGRARQRRDGDRLLARRRRGRAPGARRRRRRPLHAGHRPRRPGDGERRDHPRRRRRGPLAGAGHADPDAGATPVTASTTTPTTAVRWGADSEYGLADRRPARAPRPLPLAADQLDLQGHARLRCRLRPRPHAAPARRDGRRLHAAPASTCTGSTPTEHLPYQVYARDSSVMTPHGAVVTQMAQWWRRGEYAPVIRFYQEHGHPDLAHGHGRRLRGRRLRRHRARRAR